MVLWTYGNGNKQIKKQKQRDKKESITVRSVAPLTDNNTLPLRTQFAKSPTSLRYFNVGVISDGCIN